MMRWGINSFQKRDGAAADLSALLRLCHLLLILLPQMVAAQNVPERSLWDTHAIPLFRHLLYPRDLPGAPTVISQDKTGAIWIGTQDGLARWDGYRSRVFRSNVKDPFSLPGNFVTGLTVDNEGALYIATSTGVIVRFDPTDERFLPLPTVATATGMLFNALISDGKHGLWVGNSSGLSHFNARTNHWEDGGLPAGTKVWSLLLDRDGILWVGTEQGLLRYDQNTASFTAIDGFTSTSLSGVRILFQSTKGDIWFGKNDGTLGMVSSDARVRVIDTIQPASPIKGIDEFKPGELAIATAGSGLAIIDEDTGRIIQSIRYDPGRPSGIGGNLISNEFLDRAGGLWLTHEHGTDYLAPGTDAFLSLLPSDRDSTAFSGSNVSALAMRSDGNLWIGTERGDDIFSPTGGRKSGGTKLSGMLLRSFAITGKDQTWISTDRGVFLREKGQLKQIAALADIPTRRLFAENDLLWIGTERRGLVRLDISSNKFTFFTHDPMNPRSISDNWISAQVRDHRGNLWVATSHGLNRFDNGQFTQFHYNPADPESIPNDMVLTLLVDHENRLWIGTQGGGIAVLDQSAPEGAVIRRVSYGDGLFSHNIGMLEEDQQGQIWASTDSGLLRIDPNSLKARSFGAADGLAISAYWAGSGIRTADGTLLFGGVGGLTVVHPDRLEKNDPKPPKVVATAVHIGGSAYPAAKPLVLPPADHALKVEFAALDYAKSEKINYSYSLVGFDKGWTYTDTDHRQAAYTNVPPGHYTLLLRASTSKDAWTDPPTRISVTVLPAWYQTWWFNVCLALSALGGIIVFVRSRTALLRRRQKELEGQVAERTAEIASLLHNSGEGFLSFGPSLIIDRQYSRACETFLGEVPAGKNAAALLFAENPRHVAFVSDSVPAALSASDDHKRELILSLLPKEIDRRGRRLRLHYAIIENGHLMVVLRDITTERRLTERVASEHRRLEMIVAAVSDSRDFFDAVSNYELFVNSELPEMIASEQDAATLLRDIYRSVHTFKGIFNQFSFERTPALLHQLEDQLDRMQRSEAATTMPDIAAQLDLDRLSNALNQDLAVIRQAMGDEFLSKGGHVTMPPVQAARVKQLASLWRSGEAFDPAEPEIRELLDQIERVGSVSLEEELAAYDQIVAQVARRLEKEVAPLAVTCEVEVWLDPNLYGSFIRSLIHVFRNCVAHGIEPPEMRVQAGKDELGLISCRVEKKGGRIDIMIEDDGAGIDIAALRRRVAQSGRIGTEKVHHLSDKEVIDLIFLDNISTTAVANDWSGRGVGLAAVRYEVERLGGTISVHTEQGHGTRFHISLELEPTAQRAILARESRA